MINTFGYMGFAIAMMALGSAATALGKTNALERKVKQFGDVSDVVEIKNKLRENLGCNVKFEFYDDEPVFSAMGNVSDSCVLCRVLDFDDCFVEVEARYERKKKKSAGTFVIPIDDIKTIIVDKRESETTPKEN